MMRWLTGVLAATALLAAGCGGTTAQIGAGASDIVPASAPAFLAIDTDSNSSQWQTINELAGKFPDKQKGVDTIKSELRKESIDWAKDVKPAFGKELDFAWLDFKDNGRNFVGLVQPGNEAKFKQVIDKANASETDPSNRVVYEKFRGWEVLSPEQAVIDRFERASNSEATPLSAEHAFEQSMDRLGGDSVVRAYVNGAFLIDLARKYGGAQVRPYLDKVGMLDWIGLRLGATSDGVGLDAIVHGTPGKLFKGIPTNSSGFKPKLLGDVPSNALVYLTFHGTKNMFSGLQKNSLFRNPAYGQFAKPLQEIGKVLEGENAIYMRPGTARSPSVPFALPEVTLLAAPGKGTDGAAILDRLIKRELGTPPQAETVDGTPVHAMASNGVGLYYADIDGKLVVTDQPSGIRGVKNGGRPLSKSETFKDAAGAAGLPDQPSALLYVNISSSIPFGEKLARQRIPARIGRNLKPLRSAVEYAVSHTHEFQVSFFLRIK
jgi:hypothetical protein